MRALSLLVLVACGRIDFVPLSDGAADGVTDPSCWPLWHAGVPSLSLPTPVTSVNTASYEDNAFLAADGLELYFRSDRGGAPDFWVMSRLVPTGDFTNPVLLGSLSSAGDECTIQVTPDGHTAYISSTRALTGGDYDVYIATRPDQADDFTVSNALVAALETSGNDYDAQPVRGELRLYLSTGKPGSHIFVSDRTALDQPFAPPIEVLGVNSLGNEYDPFVSPDELTILFTSDRLGMRDIFLATRDSPTSPFSTPVPLDAINSATSDNQDMSLSADGCEVWFSRPMTGGQTDVYVADVQR